MYLLNGLWHRTLASFRAMPDFYIIGTQKGGTSSLFEYLREHPHVEPSSEKEVHYYDVNYANGKRWYRQHFPPRFRWSEFVTGEASPYYIYHPLAAARIQRDTPDAKLIALLRNPIDRAYSHYQMGKRDGFEDSATFEDAIAREDERLAGEEQRIINEPNYASVGHQYHSYLSRGDYDIQVERWLKLFPRDQFLFAESEQLFREPRKILSRVCSFLSLQDHEFKQEFKVVNQGEYGSSSMSPATRVRLQERFASSNARLFDLIGERFAW